MPSIPQFLIAAPTSGSGKTTVSRGLMALLVKKGLQVQPFKCGPDYIDTKYHAAVCGRPSINLDTFMASSEHVSHLYARYSADADAAVVEGMMGMFDGYDRDRGSSAEVARLLGIPVVLVVDARSAAYSMAPLLSGFIHFRPDVRVAGVIFNRVGSPRHYQMLQEVCEDLNVTCLGYLPKQKALEQESRYLGLDFSRSKETEGLEMLVELLEQYVDWQLLLARTSCPLPVSTTLVPLPEVRQKQILVAHNEESFSFIYEEHLAMLRRQGVVTFFNPEQDFIVPSDTDLLYLPGGYPEKHAGALSRARRTLASVRDYIENGGRTLAECGGMMYLSEGIEFDDETQEHGLFEPMAQVLPFVISNRKQCRKLHLGYRCFEYNGQRLRGHEFHYTRIAEEEGRALPNSVARVYDARGREVDTPVFRHKNLIASYTHLYWGETDIWKLF